MKLEEPVGPKETGERVVVGLIEKFDLIILHSCGVQFLQDPDDVRPIEFGLLKECSGHAQGDFKFRVFRNKLREHRSRRKIAFVRDFSENLFVLIIPQKLIPFRVESERLMKLEIECDQWHMKESLSILPLIYVCLAYH